MHIARGIEGIFEAFEGRASGSFEMLQVLAWCMLPEATQGIFHHPAGAKRYHEVRCGFGVVHFATCTAGNFDAFEGSIRQFQNVTKSKYAVVLVWCILSEALRGLFEAFEGSIRQF